MMRAMNIYLKSVSDINRFAELSRKMEGEVTVSDGHYQVNAKSVTGILVLRLSSPLRLEITDWKDEYFEMLAQYLP